MSIRIVYVDVEDYAQTGDFLLGVLKAIMRTSYGLEADVKYDAIVLGGVRYYLADDLYKLFQSINGGTVTLPAFKLAMVGDGLTGVAYLIW